MSPSVPSIAGQAASALPLPPLNLPDSPRGAGPGDQSGQSADPLASLLSGVQPIRTNVTAIQAAAKSIAQSGVGGPAVMQLAAQIVGLSQQILTSAVQSSMQPGMQQNAQPGGQPGSPAGLETPPSPSGPQPIMGAPGGM